MKVSLRQRVDTNLVVSLYTHGIFLFIFRSQLSFKTTCIYIEVLFFAMLIAGEFVGSCKYNILLPLFIADLGCK